MKCGICVRVSTGKQDTGNQLHQLRDFVRKQGWIVVAEYADQLTGKHPDREQFQQMFQDASRRKFDVLLQPAPFTPGKMSTRNIQTRDGMNGKRKYYPR